jgi:low affinity Fe/Cu permease
MLEFIRHSLTRMGEITATPAAFGLLVIYAGLWFFFDRQSLDWHAFATLSTLFMTLVIQRAEHRDTQALHAKLDELIRELETN